MIVLNLLERPERISNYAFNIVLSHATRADQSEAYSVPRSFCYHAACFVITLSYLLSGEFCCVFMLDVLHIIWLHVLYWQYCLVDSAWTREFFRRTVWSWYVQRLPLRCYLLSDLQHTIC